MSDKHHSIPIWLQPGWKWLFSLRVGLVLLVLLALASVGGTLIKELPRAQELVFYSWWYQLLLLALAVNISCATARTLIEKVLPARRPNFMTQPRFYETAPTRGEVAFGGTVEEAAEAFRRRGFQVATQGGHGYAWRGLARRWGAPLSHLGFVLVLLGGFASKWVAREGQVGVAEGGQTDIMQIQSTGGEVTTASLGFTVVCEDFDTGFHPRTRIPSHYISQVAIQEPGAPWRTGVVEVNRSLKVAGWTLHQSSFQELEGWPRFKLAVLAPNRPTTLTLELSPGQRRALPGMAGTYAGLSAEAPWRWTLERPDGPALSGALAGANGGWSVRAERFEPDFVMGESIGSRSRQLNNPALQVTLLRQGQAVEQRWLFGQPEMKEAMRGMQHRRGGDLDVELMTVRGQDGDWSFELEARDGAGTRLGAATLKLGQAVPVGEAVAAEPAKPVEGWLVQSDGPATTYATFLTVTRNPAIPLIYFGCTVMMVGLLVAFFIRPRRVWFWADARSGRLRVGAVYQPPREELDGAIRAALARLDGVGLDSVQQKTAESEPSSPVKAG